jgi:hypothetical protein
MKKSKSEKPETKELEVPKAALGDMAHAIARAGLGIMPLGGQAAIELFSAVITPPLERRRSDWMQAVGELLATLAEDCRIDLDELERNDAFIDLLMAASQTAIRTANEEKQEALRNAVRNSALGNCPDDELQQMFIGWVDELGVWHLRLLKLFQDPMSWGTSHGIDFSRRSVGALEDVLKIAYPELKERRSFYDQVWRDLHQRGLVSTDGLHSMISAGALRGRTTDMGNQFLRFIEHGALGDQSRAVRIDD